MAKTAADVLVEILLDHGVDTIFGIPGEGIHPLIEALRVQREKIRFIHVRHQESAALAACAYSKFTHKLGVCLATGGSGGIHLLNGLYDAKLDGASVLAITGLHRHDLISTFSIEDVELDKIFQDVAIYNARAMGPSHIETITDLACRMAITRRGVSHISIPTDFQSARVERHSPHLHPITHSTRSPLSEDLHHAAKILNQGRKIAILAGQGALDAPDELLQVAERLGAPIVKALLAKAVIPDENIYTTGCLGLLGTQPSKEVMETCDTLLMVGTSFPYQQYLPHSEKCRAVQIDLSPVRIGLRYPVEVGLVGDSKRCLQELLPLIQRNDYRHFLNDAQSKMKNWWQEMKSQGTQLTHPMKPQVVAWELGQRLSPQALITGDSGTVVAWWSRHIPARRGQSFALSGNLTSMACGLPYALSAALTHPGRQVVAFVGDGGFSMLMAEFSTFVKYRLPVKVVIIKNNTLGQARWEQTVMEGTPEYGCDLEPIDFVGFAQACGGTGFRIHRASECGHTLSEALETPGPVIVEAEVDPLEVPLIIK